MTAAFAAKAPPPDAGPYRKRSFLKLPVEIDRDALLADYAAIPREAWNTSHWNIHCSADMLLLRGGKQGTEADFTTRDVADAPILADLPYLAWLLGEDGPFGLPTYAFIFRMKPMGVTRPHHDNDPAWYDPMRIHIAITTNDEAHLLSERRAKHFPVGEAWTFDNQSFHAVVNGDSVRAHLIFDVLPNPKLDALMAGAEHDPGVEDPERWARAAMPEGRQPLAHAACRPLTVKEKDSLGLNPEGFAARVAHRRLIARLTAAPIRVGDIVHAVNGVETCAVARTALDYVQIRHKPGETVELGMLRRGQPRRLRLKLYGNDVPPPIRRAWRRLTSLLRR